MGNTREFKVNERENQFELHEGNTFAFLEFIRKEEKIYFTHTEAPQEMQGTGAAAQLVKEALGYSRSKGLTVVPQCSYVARYINNHTEWHDVLSEGYRM